MPKICLICLLASTLLMIPLQALAGQSLMEILQVYNKGDYARAATMTEKFIAEGDKGEPRSQGKLHEARRLLADIYAWRLDRVDKAMQIYNEIISQAPKDKKSVPLNLVYRIFIAELYENKGQIPEAINGYKDFLTEAKQLPQKDLGTKLIFAGLEDFVKYRIDSLSLKTIPDGYKLLLEKIKLAELSSSGRNSYLMILFASLSRSGLGNSSLTRSETMTSLIPNGPTNLVSEMADYMLIINSYAGSIDESAKQALEDYLDKYSYSYFSLMLRAVFYKYYKDAGQDKEAAVLLKQIETLLRERGMVLVSRPDKRFSSPEMTWGLYKKSLLDGDLEQVMECHLEGERGYMSVYKRIGPDKMRQIAEDMQPIEKVVMESGNAKYRIQRKIEGQDITFYINFLNVNGEWKIYQY